VGFSLLAPFGMAQNQQPAPQQAPPPPSINPSTRAAIQAQASQAQTAPKESNTPDYPEPRGLTVGVFYWDTFGGTQPSIFGGKTAPGYETLTDLGRYRKGPGFEVSAPITRTGSLHFEGFRIEGTGNQYAPAATTILGTSIGQGDYLASKYKLSNVKFYLDDLLFPHKFPVERFRLKGLYEFEYASISNQINAPFVPVSTTTGTSEFATGNKNVFLPALGIAAEYAITKHLLFRVDASGFGFPHHSDLWDAHALLSFRNGPVEVQAGAKVLHIKSSPQNDEYERATVSGVFVGLIYHAPFFERIH
jgi:hypothetical protein